MKKLLAVVFLMTSLLVAVPVSAQNTSKNIDCSGDNICFTPQISIPGTDIVAGQPIRVQGDTIGRYIVAIYTFGVYAGGIVATIVLMAGGFVWLLAGGNTSQVEQARTMITGAVTGYVLLLLSWVLLNTINPNLTQFKPLDIDPVNNIAVLEEKIFSACCKCSSGAGLQDCNEVRITVSGTCACPGRENQAIVVPSLSACKSFGEECVFNEGPESEQRSRAIAECQSRGPSLGQTCVLSGSEENCEVVNECRAILIESGRAGSCTANSCASGYVCNRAYYCDGPEDVGRPRTPEESSDLYINACCKLPGQIGDLCHESSDFWGINLQPGKDCADNLVCRSIDNLEWGDEIGTCQPL